MNKTKSIYSIHLKDSYSYPINSYLSVIVSNELIVNCIFYSILYGET